FAGRVGTAERIAFRLHVFGDRCQDRRRRCRGRRRTRCCQRLAQTAQPLEGLSAAPLTGRAAGGGCPILSGSFGGGRGRLIFRGRFRSRFGAGRGAASACPGSGGASGAAFARFGRGGGAATPATRRRTLVLLCLWLLSFCAGFGLVRRILVRRVVV